MLMHPSWVLVMMVTSARVFEKLFLSMSKYITNVGHDMPELRASSFPRGLGSAVVVGECW